MIDKFMSTMEEAYGKYKHGMAYGIREKINGLSQDALDLLSDKILAEYDMARPPSLKVILSTMYNHSIRGTVVENYSCSVCEYCGKDYSTHSYKCPHCGKIRKYGYVKMLKDKPPWHDAELRKMLKDEMEMKDHKRSLSE